MDQASAASAVTDSAQAQPGCAGVAAWQQKRFRPAAFGWKSGLVLVLLCLIPRAVVAWKTQVPCSDGTYYLALAQRLDQPPVVPKDAYYLINPFVLLLAWWNHLGWDALSVGKAFNVLVASLTVLPLVGWVRRQFDDSVGWLVGLGYAVHPKLVQWSGELVRDPLFWFLVAVVMYLGYRVCRERNTPGWTLPLLALVLALAWQTRVEGLGLYGVLLLWLLAVPVHPARERWRLLLRAVAWSVGAGAVVWWGLWQLGGNPQWQWGTLQRFRSLVFAEGSVLSEKTAPASKTAASGTRADSPSRRSDGGPRQAGSSGAPRSVPGPSAQKVPQAHGGSVPDRLKEKGLARPRLRALGNKMFLEAVGEGFGYLYGLLLLLSLAACWRWWVRATTLAVTMWTVVVLAFMWLHVQREGGTSTRYVVTPAMLALPMAALGWQWLCHLPVLLAARLPERFGHLGRRVVVVGGVAFLLGHLGVALARKDVGRLRCAELGRWIARQRPHASVAGMANWSVVQYYTGGAFHPINALPDGVCSTDIPLLVEQTEPDYVLLCRRRLRQMGEEQVVEKLKRMGYRPVESLPADCREFAILLRRSKPRGTAPLVRRADPSPERQPPR